MEMLKDMNSKLKNIAESNERMEKKFDNLWEENDKLKKDYAKLTSENKIMKQSLELQEIRIERLEREIRKNKIIIHGVEENKEGKNITLKKKVRVFLHDINTAINTEEEITDIRRKGNKQKGEIRPIRVVVSTANMLARGCGLGARRVFACGECRDPPDVLSTFKKLGRRPAESDRVFDSKSGNAGPPTGFELADGKQAA
ncbi:hypothetical protein FQA39_LY07203 [Lamprigera yunnana]|nr:hypothetical protein FQA39_LY07203 [Lamprigera yunnana]